MTPDELHNIFRTEEEFWWYRGMREITAALLEPFTPRSGRGLDAGCGTGYNAAELERRFGLRMTAIDLQLLAIQYCRKRSMERSLAASVMELPFPPNHFDLVSSIDVMPVLPVGGDATALQEFHRVLKPGGWLVLRVAAFRALRSRHSQYVAERHRYTAREMLRLLKHSRFHVKRWTYVNSLLSPVALFKFRLWEPLLRKPPQSGVAAIPPRWLNTWMTRALLAEAWMLGRGFGFSFGQSLMIVAQKSEAAG
jgi:ubiquinone/menaquinone biosynthesis C-methylase UbiE